jgi:hypothetical protein
MSGFADRNDIRWVVVSWYVETQLFRQQHRGCLHVRQPKSIILNGDRELACCGLVEDRRHGDHDLLRHEVGVICSRSYSPDFSRPPNFWF